ncbi:MAG TPA: IS1380 family transposase [Methylomirabilota bacterium]|nr:IS1380 family transposase [Methylomirabilota bacterium]
MRAPGVPRWCGGHHPVGDSASGPIRLSFNPQLRVEFRGATVTSDAGLLLPRELDERLGLSALIERHLSDPRTGYNAQFPLADLFRQSIYSRLAGYEDTNDAERLAEDPTFRMLASRERRDTSVALTSTLHWFETEVLAKERNYQGLTRLNADLNQHSAARSPSRRVTLDIDSSESPVHGTQEQSAYNGHFESVCYHPLFVFNPEGDCLAAKLRPGNVHSTEGWDEVLLPIIDGYRRRRQRVVVRADAAFARPEIYEALECRGVRYAIRLPANDVLERQIEDLLTRPRGRPTHAPLVRYRSFHYQAASWARPRRVIAKVEHHLGELFPRVGFIVTTLTGANRAIVRFYNQRGTAEQWIKEGKTATHWTRLSCHRFRANEVRLLLGVIAYNLGNLLRRLVLPIAIQDWSLTSLQHRLFKTGGRLIRHARYFTLQLAESYLTGPLFRQILARIERLAWHPT